MKSLSAPANCVFFTAILAVNTQVYDDTEKKLTGLYGNPILRLPPTNFTYSDYYTSEMVPNLLKGFLAFSPPFNPDHLSQRKLELRDIEFSTGFSDPSGFHRRVNIDPGYVSLFHTVLATSKNFSHRISIGNGVYAEVTLIYHSSNWEQLSWTYPDYKHPEIQRFLSQCRKHLQLYIASLRA